MLFSMLLLIPTLKTTNYNNYNNNISNICFIFIQNKNSPSLTNLDNTCSRNLDMHELDYNPSKKDLTDAKIHHLLAEELKPYRRVCNKDLLYIMFQYCYNNIIYIYL